MTLSRGVGAAVRDLVTNLTATGTGQISQVIQSVSDQNNTLAQRITVGQARLDARRTVLTAQFAQMEATIGQLQSASSSLTGLA